MNLTSDAKDIIMYAHVDIGGAIRYWEGKGSPTREEQELLKAFHLSREDLEVAFPFLKEEDDARK